MTKAWLDSLTIRGLLVVVIGLAVSNFGLPVDAEVLSDQIIEGLALVIDFVGLLMAAVGRQRADTPLGGIVSTSD